METVEFWVGKLDQPMSGGNLSTFVYYVQNAEATSLATILNSIFAEEKSKQKDKKNAKTAAAAQKAAQNKNKRNINPRTGAPTTTPFRVAGGLETQVEGDLIIIRMKTPIPWWSAPPQKLSWSSRTGEETRPASAAGGDRGDDP